MRTSIVRSKKALKELVGRKLAAHIMRTWAEDFVDEDTGEVVSLERNEIIMPRETEITEENIQDILDSEQSTILVHKDEDTAAKYDIIFNTLAKDTANTEKEAVYYIYRQLRNADPADEASAREVIQNLFFSDKRYDLGEVGRYRINKKLSLNTNMDVRTLSILSTAMLQLMILTTCLIVVYVPLVSSWQTSSLLV